MNKIVHLLIQKTQLKFIKVNSRSWNEFFNDKNYINYKHIFKNGQTESHISCTSGNIFVQFSCFIALSESTNGGAIFFDPEADESNFLVEYSVFIECKAQKDGGGICKKSNGQNVLNKNCASNCQTRTFGDNMNGPFCDICSTSKKGYLNYILNSQITECKNPNYGYTMHFVYGEPKLQYSNVSNNNAAMGTAFWFYISNNCSGIVDFCYILNNIVTTSVLFGCYETDIEFYVKNTIIVYNELENPDGCFFYLNSSTKMSDTYILENQLQDHLFLIKPKESDLYEFSNCVFGIDQLDLYSDEHKSNILFAETLNPLIGSNINEVNEKNICHNMMFETEMQLKTKNKRKCVCSSLIERGKYFFIIIFINKQPKK